MKYLPFENFVLITNLSVDEVRKRISDKVEPKNKFLAADTNSNTTKLYEGSLSADTFTISRIIHYNNTFLPVITGHILPSFGLTEIKIQMRPVTFVLLIMTFLLGSAGLVCIGMLLAGIINIKDILQNGVSPTFLIPFGLFLFGYGLISIGFKFESKISKEFLINLFEARQKDTAVVMSM